MRTAVVILNWNGAEMLKKFLPSAVAPQPQGGEYEVIVADNASTDNSMSVIEELFPQVRTIKLEKTGDLLMVTTKR